jgi:hypothetical protein
MILGFLAYRSASFVRRIYTDAADKWEEDGVVRYGGLSRKIWRDDSPRDFDSRVESYRSAAAFVNILLRGVGAVFMIGGATQLVISLFR